MLDTDTPSSALYVLLDSFRIAAQSEREKGTYFEELIQSYLRSEASNRELCSDVWTYAEWAKQQGVDGRDAGIDLDTKTQGTTPTPTPTPVCLTVTDHSDDLAARLIMGISADDRSQCKVKRIAFDLGLSVAVKAGTAI